MAAGTTRLAIVDSAMPFNLGIVAVCLGGIEIGRRELPERIDRWTD